MLCGVRSISFMQISISNYSKIVPHNHDVMPSGMAKPCGWDEIVFVRPWFQPRMYSVCGWIYAIIPVDSMCLIFPNQHHVLPLLSFPGGGYHSATWHPRLGKVPWQGHRGTKAGEARIPRNFFSRGPSKDTGSSVHPGRHQWPLLLMKLTCD